MPVDFEWEVGEEDGEWSRLATPRARRRWRPPRWIGCVLLALLLLGGGGTYVVIHQRYEEARQRLIFEIQSVLDLQARAYAQDDRELFLAQVDQSVGWWWYTQERHRLSDECRAETPPSPECVPFLPAVVEDVEVRGEFALALVREEEDALQGRTPSLRARFYRRAGAAWLYTAPRAEFWDTTAETAYKGLQVSAHRRDLPYVYPVLDRIAAAYEQVCAPVGCPDESFTISFVVSNPIEQMPRLEGNALRIDSPWLVGIPAVENLPSDYLTSLETVVQKTSLERVFRLSPDDEPNPVQRVLMSEYLEWTTGGQIDGLPLLRRLIEQQGADTLPQIIRSLANNSSPEALGRAWLAVPPENDEHLFQFLLDVEYEALLAGQTETFLLFYGLGEGTQPGSRTSSFPQAMSDGFQNLDDLPAPVVVSVDVYGYQARVTLAPGPDAPTDLPPVEWFVHQDGRWLHAMPYYILDHAQARSTRPDEPGRVTIRFVCDEADRDGYEQLAQAFTSEHPDIAVEIVPWQDLLGEVESVGAELNYRRLSQADATVVSSIVNTEAWAYDLAPLIAGDEEFKAEEIMGLETGPTMWGLPASLIPLMIHYDRDAFDAAGLSYPRLGWTADEFLSAAQALTLRGGEGVVQYGFISMYPGDMAWLRGHVCAGEEDLTAPAMVDAVRWNADLSLVHGVMFGPQDSDLRALSIESFLPYAHVRMLRGQTAMWVYPVPGSELGTEINYGFVPYPDMGCAANPVSQEEYVMSAGTRHPEETWQWLRYLSFQGVPGQLELGRSVSIPARRSLFARYARLQGWDEQDLAAVRYALEHGVTVDASCYLSVQATIFVLNGWDVEESLQWASSNLRSTGE